MKTYLQITGGRGPVECARAVALVAQELQKAYPDLVLVDYEAQNKARAKERLVLKVSAINDAQKAESERLIWNNHNTLERGNPNKTFKGSL